MDILSQARSNPEVKVSLVLDQNLRNLKEKMAGVNMVSYFSGKLNMFFNEMLKLVI